MKLSRREFLKNTAIGGACLASIGLVGGAAASENQEALTYADTIAWDGVYDVIVIGLGAGGCCAAKYAADAGAAVLAIDKAPKGHEGGNSKYCGQIIVHGYDYDKTMAYYRGLNNGYAVDEELLEVYVRGIVQTDVQLQEDFGVEPERITSCSQIEWLRYSVPEYPELPGSDTIDMQMLDGEIQTRLLYSTYRKALAARADKIDIWCDAPAKRLIQDPESRAVIGVEIEKQGKRVKIRANNGVVVASGGFENNPQMMEDFLHHKEVAVSGSLYNTGDGIKLCMEVGADLWHMSLLEGTNVGGGTVFPIPKSGFRHLSIQTTDYVTGSIFLAAEDGSRFVREDFKTRHGHVPHGNSWANPLYPERMYMVYDQKHQEKMETLFSPDYFDEVIKADTLEELAELTGMVNLVDSVAAFNLMCEQGKDLCLNRSIDTMAPFTDGPFYALRTLINVLNTQGGPRRNARGEILDVNGEPIPHLYGVGECGGVTTNLYQGGGNMAECLIFGKISGTNAAMPKEALPVLGCGERAVSEPIYTLGVDPDYVEPAYERAENQYIGRSLEGMGGELVVRVSLENGAIAQIETLVENETPNCGDIACRALTALMIEANSAEVDNIAGATVSSRAFKEAVADALKQV